ncbi:MAG: AAA family ATPase [Clostridia bacterium]|nr:AAA family ATPase [Clostridia bacterium]
MSAFDKVIGYESIKEELLQICDILKNRDLYRQMGARLPHGMLLVGDPGLGKTLMAKCFIEESGLTTYTVRRNKGGDGFVAEITTAFEEARNNAPSIVFLDDMDKFANEDNDHCDTEEYVAVQAGIDLVNGSDVFVLATVNNDRKLPDSLIRAGRFDRKIEVDCPSESDAEMIIKHFLSNKKLSDDINMEDLLKMISYSSCAELESILNEAAVSAAYGRKEAVAMNDIVKSVLRMQYNAPDNFNKISADDLKMIALHEAGHTVVSEMLCPESVGLASVRTSGGGSQGGFIHRCKRLLCDMDDVMILLAGKAAVETFSDQVCAKGCEEDIRRAGNRIIRKIENTGTAGLGMIDVSPFSESSENFNSRVEAVTHAELERYYKQAKSILIKNKAFLEKVTQALVEKGTLLFSDIQKLKAECKDKVKIV